MESLRTGRVADTLRRVHAEAEAADEPLIAAFMADDDVDAALARLVSGEHDDLRGHYHAYAANYLAVSPTFGHFLYACARARNARRIVEFGTSMGISTIYLATALRDMGGGQLIGTELEASKAARARANLDTAGLADLVDIRIGDARETLKHIDGEIDMVLLDGAFTLYLPILELLAPRLKTGAIVLAENAFAQAGPYLPYVRDPANGYISQPLPLDAGRGNEFTVRLR